MRRAILAAGVVLVAAGLGGCAVDQSVPSCVELTAEDRSDLLEAKATHAGKAENDAGWVVFLSPRLYDAASGNPRDFMYQEVGGSEKVATEGNLNETMPAELHATAELARLACSAKL